MKYDGNFISFIAVAVAYWAFMLTDGALRMLVLLHFHQLGISPLQLAYIFLIYEFMGVITNLAAGFLAKKFGLKSTLYTGLILQVLALLMLSLIPSNWSVIEMVVFATCVQAISGVAKDLTKTSAKSSVKILSPRNRDDIVFQWVAKLTGSKNAAKGLGFFLGCALIAFVGFSLGLIALGLILLTVFLFLTTLMPPELPAGTKNVKFVNIFSRNKKINLLSLARLFLFGARDVWFVVGIPLFFIEMFSDGSTESNIYVFFLIGSFMAIWTIFYGILQTGVPSFFKGISYQSIQKRLVYWMGALTLTPLLLSLMMLFVIPFSNSILVASVILGLFVFGAILAISSSLHSFLILYFTSTKRATLDVGFYYMSNAAGRLIGTFLSGLSYQLGGLAYCLLFSTILLICSFFWTLLLKRESG